MQKNNRQMVMLGIVFLGALAIRILCVFQIQGTPLFGFFAPDSLEYDRIATGLISGSPAVHLNMIYPLFLRSMYACVGHNVTAVLLTQAFLDSLTSILVFMICVQSFPRRGIAYLAAGLWALYSGAIFNTTCMLDTSLSGFLTAGALALVMYALRASALWPWLLSGIILGVAAALRASILLFPVFLSAFMVLRKRKAAYSKCALMVVGIVIVLCVVCLRSYVLTGKAAPLSPTAGLNFYIGNHPGAEGAYMLLPGMANAPIEQVNKASQAASLKVGRQLTDQEASHYWFRQGVAFIRNNPLEFIQITAKKVLLFWNARELDANIDSTAAKEFIPALNLPLVSFGFIAVFGFAGIALTLKKREGGSYPLILYSAGLMLSTIFYFVSSRYRFPVSIVLVIMAAYALMYCYQAARQGALRTLFRLAILILASAVFVYMPPWFIKEDRASMQNNLGTAYFEQHKFGAAVEHYRMSLLVRPGRVEVMNNLGNALREKGDIDAAVAEYSEALAIEPQSALTQANLASAYFKTKAYLVAAQLYEKAAACDQAKSEYLYNAAICYYYLGDQVSARRTYQQAVERGFSGDRALITAIEQLAGK